MKIWSLQREIEKFLRTPTTKKLLFDKSNVNLKLSALKGIHFKVFRGPVHIFLLFSQIIDEKHFLWQSFCELF